MAGIPALNSLPGATAQLYLDFDGHFESTWGSYSNLNIPAWDKDGNPSDYNAEEVAYIQDVWKIVAEDFAPLKINVTTVQPSVLAAGQPTSAANGIALRIAIGGDDNVVLGNTGGLAGVAQYNSFTNTQPNLALVFPVSSPGSYMSIFSTGTTVSHEAGHSFGLRHHVGDYDFSAGWSALMNGSVFGYENTWWTTGKDDLGNLQDDLGMLSNATNGFGYRTDDVGNTVATASNLTGAGTTFSGAGVISSTSDVDVWKLSTANSESLKIRVDGSTLSQNLDAVLEFMDSAGNVLYSANPSDSDDAELIIPSTGVAYVAVRSTGAYGRIGQYSLSVIESTPGIAVKSESTLHTSESGIADQFSVSLTYRPTADVTVSVASSDPNEGAVSTNLLTFTPDNWYLPQQVTITGVDDFSVDGPKGYQIVLGPASSADPAYDGLTLSPLTVINADNDVPGKAVQLGGIGYAYIIDMVATADGSLYVTGSYDRSADLDPGTGETILPDGPYTNSFVAKYSQTFDLMWVKRIGGEDGNTSTRGIALDNSGNVFVTGYTSESAMVLGSTTLNSIGSTDAFLAKLNPQGDFLWAKNWGGTSGTYNNDLVVDANTVHIAGYFSATVDFNPGSATLSRTSAGGTDIAISRFDLNGNFLSVTTTGSVNNETISQIAGDFAGGVYATGSFTGGAQLGGESFTSAGPNDGYLFKVNAAGAITWAKQIATPTANLTNYRLATTSAGEVYLAGAFTDTIQLDANTTFTSAGGTDAFISRWAPDGTLQQVGQLAGVGATSVSDIKVDNQNRPALMGIFAGTVNMQPFGGESLQTAAGAAADYILRLDVGGGVLGFHQMPRDVGVARILTHDAKGNLYATGNVNKAVPMPTGEILRNLNGGIDAYLLRINTAPGIRVSPTSGLTTTENGGAASFSVVLDTAPTADVTLTLASSDLTEGTLSHSTLTFTPANWRTPQVVTITGVNDTALDNDQAYNIVFGATASSDPAYNGLTSSAVSVINRDDEITVATFTKTDGRIIPDRGTLNSDLVVGASGSIMDINVRVNITHGWNQDLDVTLIAPDGTRVELFTDVGGSSSNFTNTLLDQSAATLITAGSAPFSGTYRPEGNLSLLNGKSISGTWRLEVKDDERLINGTLIDWSLNATYSVPVVPAGVTVTPTSGLTTSENGTSATFTVVLTSAPDANATIAITSSDLTEGTVSVSNLTFTPANWNVPQTVTVTGVNDSIVDGAIGYSIITGAVVSTDPRYSGFTVADVSVTNQDNDTPPPPTTIFQDSFEVGQWNNLWVEDSQNDWDRLNQRATQGSWSAEIDGSATNATLTTASSFNVTTYSTITLTYSWYIESSWDSGEYIALDVSTNGGSTWTQNVRQIRGNVEAENTWLSQTVDLTPYKSSQLRVRFRSSVSDSAEDGNVDNVLIVGVPAGGSGEAGSRNATPIANAEVSPLRSALRTATPAVGSNGPTPLQPLSNDAAWANYDAQEMLAEILDRRGAARKTTSKWTLS